MAVATFDTLKFANTLKAAGVPDKQAEAQAAVLADALAVNFKDLVTKDDLQQSIGATEQRLNARMDLVRTELTARIDQVRMELKNDLRETEQRLNAKFDLLKWMTGLAISMLIAVLVRLFFFRAP